jgi:hypothetical protein
VWVGEAGVRLYSAGQPGGARADRLLYQAKLALDDPRNGSWTDKSVLFLGFPTRRDDAEYSLSSRRNNEVGESKKGAILFVATFTHKVN